MSRMTFSCLFFCICIPLLPQGDDPEAAVKTVVRQFLEGRQNCNLDDVMKTVDVPWFHDNKSVITDRAELKAEFHRLLSRKNQSRASFEIEQIHPYKDLREKFTLPEQRMLDRVLAPTDRVVFLSIGVPGQDRTKVVPLFVRVRDDKARVVGLLN